MVDGKIILGKAIESCNLYIEYVLILIIRMSPFIEQHFFFFFFLSFGRTAIEAYDAHRYFKRGNPSYNNIASNISLFTRKIHFLNITIAFPGNIRTIDWSHHINNQGLTFFSFFFWLKIYTHSQTKIWQTIHNWGWAHT